VTLKRIATAVVVLALIVGAGWYWQKNKAAKNAEDAYEIETATVERKDLTITVSASGVLEALTTVEVKSRSGGEITGMFVEAGDYVEAGQLIAQCDPTQIRSKARQASANVSAARASAAQARLNASLQQVQTGTSMVQAEAGLESAHANLKQAEEQLAQERQTTADAVRKGQAALKSARARLSQAVAQRDVQGTLHAAEVASAEASVESARQNLAKLRAGARPQEIAQAKASLRSAEAGLHNAKKSLQRNEGLLAKGFVSKQAVDDAKQSYEQALAQRDSAKEALGELEAGSRVEDIAQAEAQLVQAEASLRLARTNEVQISLKKHDVVAAEASVIEAEATLASAKAQSRNVQVREQQLKAARAAVREAEAALHKAESGPLENEVKRKQIEVAMADVRRQMLALEDAAYDLQYTRVVAPRSGVIMEKLVEEGTVIPAGTADLREGTGLVTIADISKMYVLADVDEVDIAPVEVGQKCEISVSSLPDRKLKGLVVKIFPLGVEDQNVVRFQVKVHIEKPPTSLRPGMTADVTIKVAERSNVLVVPDLCITRTKDKTTVEVILKEALEEREVKVGLSNWEETEILEGLEEGEEVLIPPPPGTELPHWMGGGDKKDDAQRRRSRMMRQFRGR